MALARERLLNGLAKLHETNVVVDHMQRELSALQPVLVEKAQATQRLLGQVRCYLIEQGQGTVQALKRHRQHSACWDRCAATWLSRGRALCGLWEDTGHTTPDGPGILLLGSAGAGHYADASWHRACSVCWDRCAASWAQNSRACAGYVKL